MARVILFEAATVSAVGPITGIGGVGGEDERHAGHRTHILVRDVARGSPPRLGPPSLSTASFPGTQFQRRIEPAKWATPTEEHRGLSDTARAIPLRRKPVPAGIVQGAIVPSHGGCRTLEGDAISRQ